MDSLVVDSLVTLELQTTSFLYYMHKFYSFPDTIIKIHALQT